MRFFDSEIIKKELLDIEELQLEIFDGAMKLSEMSMDEKIDHMKRLQELLSKQQVYYTRLCLSDDEDAKVMRGFLEESAVDLGLLTDGKDLMTSLQSMQKTLSDILESLDEE